MTTKEIIEEYFECINSGDWETWLTLFDDNVVFDEAISGHIEGIQSLKESVESTEKEFSMFRVNPRCYQTFILYKLHFVVYEFFEFYTLIKSNRQINKVIFYLL